MKKSFFVSVASLLVASFLPMSLHADECEKPTVSAAQITFKYADVLPDGWISNKAVFTVGTDKKVTFAKGNLQFRASNGKDWTSTDGLSRICADGIKRQGIFRFAEHQYDFVGSSNNKQGNVYEGGTKCSNTNISNSYTGWIDLFGWATSGWWGAANGDPRKTYANPWFNSNNSSYYSASGSSSDSHSLVDTYKYADWGVYNPIEGGGDAPEMWRLLTSSEMNYLFNSRDHHDELYGFAKVNGVMGLIILPDYDVWEKPNSITSFTATTVSYTVNTYDIDEWADMEENGAVFLPLSGFREGTSVSVTNFDDNGMNYCVYWTSSSAGSMNNNYASGLHFGRFGNCVFIANYTNQYANRAYGNSVRLVQDIE